MNPTSIPSPFQGGDDGLLLTPQQRQERQKQKVDSFVTGLKKLEQETGMCLRVSLQYSPEGIFPGGRIVPLTANPNAANLAPIPTPPVKTDDNKSEETKTEEA